MIPSFQTYAGPSSLQLFIGSLTIWFSYDTPVAFMVHGCPKVISENRWGVTTGKHLNAIDRDKSNRIPFGDMISQLEGHLEDVDRALEGMRVMLAE